MTPRVPSREWLSWLAGFLDGEGSFSYHGPSKGRGGRTLELCCGNTCREVLVQIQDHLGRGSVHLKSYRKANPRWKWCYEWSVTGSDAQAVAELVLPFLCVKKRQAEVFLRFPTSRKGRHRSASESLNCDALRYQLRALNRKGSQGAEDFNASGEPGQGSLPLDEPKRRKA